MPARTSNSTAPRTAKPQSTLTVAGYIAAVDGERQTVFRKLRKTVKDNLPTGFVEQMNYGMIGYVVPHRRYPDGYHCDPKLPLPFMAIAAQKGALTLYHMGLYADAKLMRWFTEAYAKAGCGKLDMGKSCIRFRKPESIPFDVVGELAAATTVDQWIALYEKNLKR